ncbi:MAG: radical SAM family heme chaperone HemW [Clostridia bacterium]|nr:radical SAM family heme chaperone HemW [Clostridia bacterium]
MNNDIGIYIHIPFCLQKCFYCDFNSYANKQELVEKYTFALCNEILKNAEILSQYKISTIYIGGGTPSYIDSKYIKQILDTLLLFVDKEYLKEVTIEVNPNSVTEEKLKVYKESGVNRLSIGLQSNHNDILKKIGRAHKIEEFEKALDLANKVGFTNISADLIYPLPDLDLNRFNETLDYILNLKDKNIKHISIYNLEIHENTKLKFLLDEGYVTLVDEDEEYEMYTALNKRFKEAGYNRYEISNYSIQGYESNHNLRYWNQSLYLGFGAGASSFFGGSRYRNENSIEKYISYLDKGISIIAEKEDLDLLSLMKEYVMLALRKIEGLDVTNFKSKYKKDVYELFSEELNSLINDGLLEKEGNYIHLTQRGLEVANLVWEKFV